MIKLFTLPTCPICEMVKKKLSAKKLHYIELPFEQLPKGIDTERAPVMAVSDSLGEVDVAVTKYLLSPIEINKWIEEA